MKKKTLIPLLLTFTALILMILPVGAILEFAVSPTENSTETFSYFSLMVWGYGNMFPFLSGFTAVFSLAGMILKQFIKNVNVRLNKVIMGFSIASTCTSILAVLFFLMIGTVSAASIIIAILLLSASIMLIKRKPFIGEKRIK